MGEPLTQPPQSASTNTGRNTVATVDRRDLVPAQVERIPWSVLGPEFAMIWGRADPNDPQPEHMEITGMNGSGKTHLLAKVLQDRMIVRDTPEIIICTKPADNTILRLGWPIVDDYQGVRKNRQCIFWPRTKKLGRERRAYHEAKIYDLLDRIWVPNSNRIVAFDEIAYAESLSPDMRDIIEMYWREARSQGITVVGMKQRAQGTNRHMHSETPWTVGFVPADENDAERIAELFGPKKVWLPVFEQMNPENHEFLIRHTKSRTAYISWVDEPLVYVEPPSKREHHGSASLYGA